MEEWNRSSESGGIHMRHIIATGALSLLLFFISGTAHAVDTDGKFGVGGLTSLGSEGVSGLSLNYWVGGLKTGIIAGIRHIRPKEGDNETNLNLAFQGLYSLSRTKRANFNTGLRIVLKGLVTPTGEEMEPGLEIPLEAEFWVTEHVSVLANAGLGIYFPKDRTVVEIGSPRMAVGAGFNFYF